MHQTAEIERDTIFQSAPLTPKDSKFVADLYVATLPMFEVALTIKGLIDDLIEGKETEPRMSAHSAYLSGQNVRLVRKVSVQEEYVVDIHWDRLG